MEISLLKSETIRKKRKKIRLPFLIIFTLFCLYALSLIIPFLWAIMNTFKTEAEYLNNKTYFPRLIDWTNYLDAFKHLSAKDSNMFLMLWNSTWWSVGGTLFGLFSSTLSAYIVAKYKFFGRGALYMTAIITMMLPIIGAMPSQFTVYDALGILNSPAMLITCAGGFGFNFIVLYGFFRSLSWDYIEASFLDGAGHFRTMFLVMLPQALAAIGALGIVSFIALWNDYNTPIVFLESYPMLASGLYLYQNATMQHSVDIPLLFAGVIMSVIPALVLFIVFQNSIMNVSFGGGLKG